MENNGLIDNRNIGLWNTLSNVFEINIQRHKLSTYGAYSKNIETTIFVPIDSNDPASFTHELLHIFLRFKNVFIGAGLQISIKENKVLSQIFSDGLIEHIGNSLDHIKMFPLFVELGYKPEDFISDYSENKLTNEEILKIKKHFIRTGFLNKVYYNRTAIDLYIGKYFASISCTNNSYNYSNQLTDLRTLDPKLFQILDDLVIAWKTFDYDNDDPITGGYQTLLFDFINSLDQWTIGKTIK